MLLSSFSLLFKLGKKGKQPLHFFCPDCFGTKRAALIKWLKCHGAVDQKELEVTSLDLGLIVSYWSSTYLPAFS